MIDDEDTREYACPFCQEWVRFTSFVRHEAAHPNLLYKGMTPPKSLDELRDRFSMLGMYEERDTHSERG